MQAFKYIGPKEICKNLSVLSRGTVIESRDSLIDWISKNAKDENGWATYIVNIAFQLLLAPRKTEHVACAGGEPVLAAGEIRIDKQGNVLEINNNSTGYCPSENCWEAIQFSLTKLEILFPRGFTFIARFRQCQKCGERNLVKEDWFYCAYCNSELPKIWNFKS